MLVAAWFRMPNDNNIYYPRIAAARLDGAINSADLVYQLDWEYPRDGSETYNDFPTGVSLDGDWMGVSTWGLTSSGIPIDSGREQAQVCPRVLRCPRVSSCLHVSSCRRCGTLRRARAAR